MTPPRSAWLRPAALLFLTLPLYAGCAAPQAGERPNALSWARYVSGEDLRAGCTSGAPDRLRLIFRQADRRILAYDIREVPEGATIQATRIGTDDGGRLRIEEPGAGDGSPAEIRLSPRLYAELMVRLAAGAVFKGRPAPSGPPPDGHIWLVSGCYDGVHFLGLWTNPHPGNGRAALP